MDGGAGEGLGASLSEPCDPVRSRAWGLAGTLGGGELKGREGQEHAVQGRAPWGLGPALEAESFQSCPTVRMYAQGEGGAGRGGEPWAFSGLALCALMGGLEEHQVWGWTHTHTHTHSHTHISTCGPAFMSSVMGPVPGTLRILVSPSGEWVRIAVPLTRSGL